MTYLLEVKDLEVSFFTYAGEVQALRKVNFHVDKGEVVAIVGESGCGKSVTAQSVMRLIPTPPGKIKSGTILLNGENLLSKSEREMERIRGNSIAMIFQDPMTSLNPVLTIGGQIIEGLRHHQKLSKKEARSKAIEMLGLVGIPSPERRLSQYPHEFSGGMRQRVMIAMALACNPQLLIADEPTTALDVTIQAQIMELMKDLNQKLSTSIIIITHDLGVVAGLAQRVLVMYAGKIIEQGTVKDLYQRPRHPYTWGLLKSVPRLDAMEKKRLVPIWGQPPDLLSPPAGCAFYPRCDYAMEICTKYEPEVTSIGQDHKVACWLSHPSAPEAIRANSIKGGAAGAV
ncbi:MAG: oligopeptide transport system ATP-binding protein [Clostridia bacterium]|jgi:oligopeptide transport system ATP-binding protein|nr:oligopeptide transport system ATP-binding protein [Clostridiales bacterium]MDK2986421.1 oligopeptide transport system ATP-binding protein [Clostridia bacterium]